MWPLHRVLVLLPCGCVLVNQLPLGGDREATQGPLRDACCGSVCLVGAQGRRVARYVHLAQQASP